MFVFVLLCTVPAAAVLPVTWFCRSAHGLGRAMEEPARLDRAISRRGDRPQLRVSGATARRRHLAAVLPADARR